MAGTPLEVGGAYKRTNKGNVDFYYDNDGNGWPSKAAACHPETGVPTSLRQRKKVLIEANAADGITIPTEFWWPTSAVQDSDMVEVAPTYFANPLEVLMDDFEVQEQGSTATIAVKGSIDPGDESGAITARELLKNGQPWESFTGDTFSKQDTISGNTVYSAMASGARSGPRSVSKAVTFAPFHRFGAAAERPTTATARSLAGKGLRPGESSLVIESGTEHHKFYFLIAPGFKIKEILDRTIGYYLTSSYELIDSNFTVKDAAGVSVSGFKLYGLEASIHYHENHRHIATVIPE